MKEHDKGRVFGRDRPMRGEGDMTRSKRKATAIPGGGGGGWNDPTLYDRKAEAEAKAGHKMTTAEFRASEHYTPPENYNGGPAVTPGGLTLGPMRAQYTGEGGNLPFAGKGLAMNTQEWVNENELQGLSGEQSGTSVFDPVLCELAYRWFCPPDGLVLDPFAGGSVRGIVASRLGRRYIGIDLRPEQIAANEAQAREICPDNPPQWIEGDSVDLQRLVDQEVDFIFSCPPYADLERYSDDPRDISTMDYPAFREALGEIVRKACGMLKPDRFACFVIGDARGKDGNYYGLPGHTVEAFAHAGLALYNHAILVTAVGSLPIRVTRQFEVSRKLGTTHQHVLVFLKGDAKAATAACGPVEFGSLDEAAVPDGKPNGNGSGMLPGAEIV